MTLDFKYDKEADAVYIHLDDRSCAYTKPLDDMRYVDYASDDTPIGIELLGVSDGVNLDDLPEQAQVAKLLEGKHIKALA